MKTLVALLILFGTVSINAQNCEYADFKLRIREDSSASLAEYGASKLNCDYYAAMVVVLGESSTGVYTIESGIRHDASDQMYANLVHTKLNGQRTEYLLFSEVEYDNYQLNPDRHRSPVVKAKKRLREFEKMFLKKELIKPVDKERLDNSNTTLTYKHSTEDVSLTWSLNAEPDMCWCIFSWSYGVSKKSIDRNLK